MQLMWYVVNLLNLFYYTRFNSLIICLHIVCLFEVHAIRSFKIVCISGEGTDCLWNIISWI